MLDVISNPDDDEYDSMLVWLGGVYDPEEFDMRAINSKLRKFAKLKVAR
jgi:hypothetical protein